MAVTLFAAPAAAVEPDDPEIVIDPEAEAQREVVPEEVPEVIIVESDEKKEGPGASLSAGGGIFGFAEENARDATTDVGGAYTARLHLGTTTPVGFELAYIGTAQNLDTLGVDDDALLISNGAEGAVTVGLPIMGMFHPYAVGGAAWKRYSVENTDTNTSAVRSEDDVLELPVGGGLMMSFERVIIDARGQYRFAFEEDLLEVGNESLDNWDVTLRAGMKF